MPDDDLREQIEQLEARIEALAETAERCRKIILFAKAAIVAGALVVAVFVLGPVRFDPAVMIGGIAAVIGGIVMRGSNRTTMEQTVHAMQSAGTLRDELIGRIELRTVSTRQPNDAFGSAPDTHRTPPPPAGRTDGLCGSP